MNALTTAASFNSTFARRATPQPRRANPYWLMTKRTGRSEKPVRLECVLVRFEGDRVTLGDVVFRRRGEFVFAPTQRICGVIVLNSAR